MLVDAHQHFWKLDRGDYHWMSPDLGVLYRDYLPADLAPILRRAGVSRTIAVQAAPTEDETSFLLGLAEETDFIAGVVGWLDFEDPSFPHKLDALLKRPKLAGLRPMLQDLDDDAYILRPRVIENLRHIAARNCAFDILIHSRHLGHVARALEMVPGLHAVVDHISKPRIADGQLEGWAEKLARLASFPGVYCKLSGLITEASHYDWRPAHLQPFVLHAFDAFGPNRVMFGSDWPVCLLAGSYAEVLNALRTILDPFLSQEEMERVYGRNAIEFYRLRV